MKLAPTPASLPASEPLLDTPSKQKRYATQCREKARFNTEAKAIANATKWANALFEDRFVYPCDICGFFHVSSDMIRLQTDFPHPCAVVVPTAKKPRGRITLRSTGAS